MKKVLSAALVFVASSFFISAAVAEDAKLPCDELMEGVKALCGEEVAAALATTPRPPEEECTAFMAEVDKVVAEHPGATEAEMVEFLVAICAELAKP